MTIHPQLSKWEGPHLVLRSFVHSTVTKSLEVNFLQIFLGFMALSLTDDCDHPQRSMIADSDVSFTSVDAPLAKGKTQIAVTLTHWNPEAQFLSCVGGYRALYQAKGYLPCAVMQARKHDIKLVIGGEC